MAVVSLGLSGQIVPHTCKQARSSSAPSWSQTPRLHVRAEWHWTLPPAVRRHCFRLQDVRKLISNSAPFKEPLFYQGRWSQLLKHRGVKCHSHGGKGGKPDDEWMEPRTQKDWIAATFLEVNFRYIVSAVVIRSVLCHGSISGLYSHRSRCWCWGEPPDRWSCILYDNSSEVSLVRALNLRRPWQWLTALWQSFANPLIRS